MKFKPKKTMKKINLFIVMLIMFLSASCVSTRTASTQNKAENRIIKYNKGMQNQIEAYPKLVDKAFTIIEEKEIYIPGDSLKLSLLLNDIKTLDSLNQEYLNSNKDLDQKLDSLLSISGDTAVDLNLSRGVIKNLLLKVSQLNKLNKDLFKKYNEAMLHESIGTYQDSAFVVDYIYKEGILSLDIKVKDKYQLVETSKTQYEVDIRKNFWQDIKFWGFMIVILNLFYFFGDIIKAFLNKILIFIRKLFIKV